MTQFNFSLIKKTAYAVLFLATAFAFAQDRRGTSGATFERPRAATAYRPSIGLTAGYAETEGKYDAGMGYGIEAGFQPLIPFRLAIEFAGYSGDSEGNSPKLTRTELLAKATYELGGDIPLIRHSYFGADAGAVWDRVDNQTEANAGYGPVAGFDIPLSDFEKKFSLGANANYLFVGGAKADMFALNAMAKYWF